MVHAAKFVDYGTIRSIAAFAGAGETAQRVSYCLHLQNAGFDFGDMVKGDLADFSVTSLAVTPQAAD